ncbi:MAG TPA: hypothetical protein VHS56_13795, partial [Candidatus Cybelea sp.]|nr:hypothetical protein [Candidatus Cybelea sp.]
VEAEEIARLTAFFESRNATPRVFVTPLSDPSLATGLARAGYAPGEYENVLVSDDFETYSRRDDRVSVATNLDDWAAASMKGFLGDEAEGGDPRVGLILASSEGTVALAGRDGETIASTAIMSVRGECAFFFAGATVPEFRRRGWHLALVRDRIARARHAGVRVMRATARPGTASERNFRRSGFEVLYTRSLWERRAALSAYEPG